MLLADPQWTLADHLAVGGKEQMVVIDQPGGLQSLLQLELTSHMTCRKFRRTMIQEGVEHVTTRALAGCAHYRVNVSISWKLLSELDSLPLAFA